MGLKDVHKSQSNGGDSAMEPGLERFIGYNVWSFSSFLNQSNHLKYSTTVMKTELQKGRERKNLTWRSSIDFSSFSSCLLGCFQTFLRLGFTSASVFWVKPLAAYLRPLHKHQSWNKSLSWKCLKLSDSMNACN